MFGDGMELTERRVFMSMISKKENTSKNGLLKDFSISKYATILLTYLFLCVIVVVLLGLASWIPDPDSFFIIKTGEYIVENKEVPTINPFVIHEDFAVVIQQWAFDVFIYMLYNALGYAGLFLYSGIALLVAIFLTEKFVGMYTQNINHKLILLTIFVWVYRDWAVVRPTSISFSLLLSVIMILENYKRGNGKWMIALLPVISVLLVNIHVSMWPLMFVMMLPYVFPNVLLLIKDKKDYLKSWIGKWWKVLLLIIPMFAIGFLNPNGANGMLYVIKSYKVISYMSINELYPPYVLSVGGILIIATIVILVQYILRNKTGSDSANCYMAMGTLYMGMSHQRNLWYCLFGALPLFAMQLEVIKLRALQNCRKIKKVAQIIMTLVLCIVIFAVSQLYTFYVADGKMSPVQAANYLDQFNNQEDIVLYTDFNSGAYMEFRGYKVYMDARPELFSEEINGKKDVLTEWEDLIYQLANVEGILDEYGFTHLIVENNGALYGYMMNHPDFEHIISGKGYQVYERIGWEGDSKLVHP